MRGTGYLFTAKRSIKSTKTSATCLRIANKISSCFTETNTTDMSDENQRDIELRDTKTRLEDTILELSVAKRRMDAVIRVH